MALTIRHRSAIAILGGLASVVFMYLAVRRLDYVTLRDVLLSVQIWPWVPIGAASYIAGHLVRGVRCQLLVRHEANLRVTTAANVVVVGYAANNVFPARMGEFVRAGMLTERTGIPIVQSLTITLIERVLDGLAILALLLFGLSIGSAPAWAQELARIGLVVFGIAFAATMLAVQTPSLLISAASRIGSRLSERWHDRLVRIASSVAAAGACLRNPRDTVLIAAYSILVWVLEAGMFVALLPAFGIAPSLAVGAVAMSITNLGLLVPSTPGFIGPFHYFCSQALVAQGATQAVGLAYATVVHLTFYLPVTLWGALAMLWYGVEVGATATVARAARSSVRQSELHGLLVHEVARLEGRPAAQKGSTFLRCLVEAMVVGEGQPLDAPVIERTANFVQGQVGALPRRLALLLEVGMTMFRFTTRARFMRGYCDLPLSTRRAWTLAWSDSRYSIFRKLFKPLRATALLAYHEQPGERMVASAVRLRNVGPVLLAPTRLVKKTGTGRG
jgi:uncharacterized protein (TIRG00374 family)